MRRRYTNLDLVQLPRLDAGSAQALSTQVLTAAKAFSSLPEAVTEAVDTLALSVTRLQDVAVDRLPRAKGQDPLRAKTADTAIDSGWSGTFDWLTGWSKIPGVPEAKTATALLNKLFPDGLKFVLLVYEQEWAESNNRLLLIERDGLEASFKQLGGEKILARLRTLHAEYGDALGVTFVVPDDIAATLQGTLNDVREALRAFVVQATAMVRKNQPESAKTSRALLAPIANWAAPPIPKADAEEPLAPSPGPTPPAATTAPAGTTPPATTTPAATPPTTAGPPAAPVPATK